MATNPRPPQTLVNLSRDVALYLQELAAKVDEVDTHTNDHNTGLTGHQGGSASERYHLTSAQHTGLGLLSSLTIDADKDWNSKDITNADNIEAATAEIGALTLTGSTPITQVDTTWEDLRVPVNAIRVGTSRPPTWTAYRTTLELLGFSDQAVAGNEEQVYFVVQFPHSMKLGTGSSPIPHLHWTPGASTTVGSVRWALEYTWANIGDNFPATNTIYVDSASDGTAHKHIIASFGALDFSSNDGVSPMIICRLYRNSSHANDTFTSSTALLLEFDFHFEVDTPGGSAQSTSKT